ncbi:serine/threonine-protein kinase [Nocardia sp. NPDC051750]|uniref:serine/threonine-protein kinase n=1 Tax=Nocardia sp. NPDC051750 TaxID=3364325 RepID=UPI0037AA5B71
MWYPLLVEGTPFGRYRLLELLGAGAMGEVHRAYDTGTDRLVAVKVLAPEFAHNATYRKRFQREAQAAARLAEPHIVPIHDFGEIDGRLFLDMRLVQGPNLATLLAERDRLEPAEAVEVVAQIAAALDAAHAEGLVHRDVKPSNILVTRAGFAYLIDFGIARSDEDTTVTTTGAVIGTFAYMAPERLADDDSGAPSDVYSLACVLYECLVGAKPYRGESMQRQIAAHLNDEPPSPSTAGLPSPFDAVIAKGMAKDPGRRYETAGELAAAARAALWEPPTAPSPVPAVPAPRSGPAPASVTPAQDPAEPASAAPAPASAASATPGAASDPVTPVATAPAPADAPGPAGPAPATPAAATTPVGPPTTRFPRRAAVVLSVLALAVAGTSALALTRDTSTLVTETPVTTAPVTRSATTAPVTSRRPSSPPPQPAPPVSVSESVPVTSIAPEGPVAVPAPPPAWTEPEPQPGPPLPPPTVTATPPPPITTTPPPPITTTTVEPTESETTTPETTTSETTSETTVTTTTDETGEEASGDDSADATGSTIATSSPIGSVTTSPTTRTPADTAATTPGSTATSPPPGAPQQP